MPSWDGLKTWFDYELLIFTGVITVALTLVAIQQLGPGLPLAFPWDTVDSPAFAAGFLAISTIVMGVLFWLAAQYSESPNQ